MKKIQKNISLYLLMLASLGTNINNVCAQDKALNICVDKVTEYAPSISSDGKTLFYQSNSGGGYKIFYTSVDQSSGTCSAPIKLSIAGDFSLVGGPSISADGKTLYFCAHSNIGQSDMDIYYCTKNNDQWSAPKNVGSPVNTEGFEGFPSISPDGKLLFFTRHDGLDDSNAGCSSIWVAQGDSINGWKNIRKVNTGKINGCVKAPTILADNKTLLFASNNSPQGKGGYDILKGDYTNGELNNIVALGFLNTDKDDHYASLYNNEEIIYLSRSNDIYAINVPYNEWIIKNIYLSVKTLDISNDKRVGSYITLTDKDGTQVLKKDSSTSNTAFANTIAPYKAYQLNIQANGFNDTTITLDYTSDPGKKYQDLSVKLSPKTKAITFQVLDAENNEGLSVDITITNLDLNEQITISNAVGRDGKYTVNLREGSRYNIEVNSSEGYAYARTEIAVPISSVSTIADSSIAMNSDPTRSAGVSEVTLKVTPLKSGNKLQLQDIYFDYNAYTLQEASHAELDRVVDLMNENPKIEIEVSAHTDDKGSDDYNMRLSEKRAEEIVKYLVSKGVSRSRLRPKGYGKTKPVAPNNTEENRAKNRRVELKVIDII